MIFFIVMKMMGVGKFADSEYEVQTSSFVLPVEMKRLKK